MPSLSQDQLRRLARLGAMARLEELRREEAAIRAEFPDLFGRGRKRASDAAAAGQTAGGGARRRRAAMSVAGRKAVSERMRKYWAERRKAKAAK
jgi:uncharacterized Ntn-hydrolase superfamily protein